MAKSLDEEGMHTASYPPGILVRRAEMDMVHFFAFALCPHQTVAWGILRLMSVKKIRVEQEHRQPYAERSGGAWTKTSSRKRVCIHYYAMHGVILLEVWLQESKTCASTKISNFMSNASLAVQLPLPPSESCRFVARPGQSPGLAPFFY